VPLLRRHHEAPPDDPKTWSACGKGHVRLPLLQRSRYKGTYAGGVGVRPSLVEAVLNHMVASDEECTDSEEAA
jgi:hypothetical protein